MEDSEFLKRIKLKIERLTGSEVSVHIDHESESRIHVELDAEIPEVVIGYNVLLFPGFARMSIEYAVASIRQKRQPGPLEFHILLARN